MPEILLYLESNWQNLLAVGFFLLCFKGYTAYAARAALDTPCLANAMHRYRAEWMERMLTRDLRVADTTAIANLERSVAFFASTTLLILAGLVTVLGSTEKAIDVITSASQIADDLVNYVLSKYDDRYDLAIAMVAIAQFLLSDLPDKERDTVVSGASLLLEARFGIKLDLPSDTEARLRSSDVNDGLIDEVISDLRKEGE